VTESVILFWKQSNGRDEQRVATCGQTMWIVQTLHLRSVPLQRIGRGSTHNLWAAIMAACALIACAGAPIAQPPPDDCVRLRLWSNGWHAAIALPAEAFGERHPLRALFPNERYFLVSWGARDFYMADKAGFWDGVFAIAPPTSSAMHVIAGKEPVEETFWRPREMVDFAVSRSAARALADSLAARLVFNGKGAPIILGEGRVAGASYFLESKGQFHLFNMCNHWTARRLKEAGLPVRAGLSFTAGGLMSAVRRKTPRACRAIDNAF